MPSHVYADANIFLDFFRFSDDDLGELEKLSQHMQDDNIVLHLPQLTAEEYFRNRDKVVVTQLAEIRKLSLKVGIPIFIRDSEKAKAFQERLENAFSARNDLMKEVETEAAARNFRADKLIASIFAKANRIGTDSFLVERAQQRLALGNPPGKPGSIGDRLNWESLLHAVPHESDLYLLTRDTDYLTSFPAVSPNMFLVNEWAAQKGGEIKHYLGIKPFAKHIDESIVFAAEEIDVFPPDPARTAAIDDLAAAFSFSQAHAAVGQASKYIEQFSPAECETLLDIALSNSQVGGIMGDDDVHSFYEAVRSKMPWFGNAVADKFDNAFGDFTDVPF